MKTMHHSILSLILTFSLSLTIFSQRTNVAYQIGGLEPEDVKDIAFDDAGNMYVTGIFRGTVDFDPYGLIGTGDERTSNGESDIFIQKYGANNFFLSPIDWTITVGGTGIDVVSAITVSKGSDPVIYIGGQYENTVDFDPDPGNTAQHPAIDETDAFIAGYNADGHFEEFVYMPGMAHENVTDLHIVGDSLVYIGGEFSSNISFDPIEGIYEDSNGNYDMFIAKYKPSTNKFLWESTIGGSGLDDLTCLEVDDADSLYIGGGFSETVDFDPSASEHNVISAGFQDAFISCFDPEGNFQWVEKLGNSESNQTTALTIAGDTIWSASYFYDDIGFQVGFVGGFPILKSYSSNGSKDILLQKHLTNGTNLTSDWRHIGGALVDQVNDMDYDSRNKLIITGFFSGNNFDLDPDDTHEDLFHSSGAYDLFIAKVNGSYEYIWGNTISNPYSIVPRALNLKKNDDIRIAGSFSSEIDFNPWGPAPLSKTSKGFTDGFIINIKPYSDSCEILSFTLPDQTGPASIDDTLFAIDIEVEYGTDLTLLSPTIDVSAGATIDPASGQGRDFSDVVIYTVTAEDSVTTREWDVVVSIAPNTETDIISFELTEQTGAATIDPTEHTVDIEVEYGTDLTLLSPTIDVSAGATIDPASGQSRDFSDTVVYTVMAEDSVTTRDWNVIVSVAPNTETDIISFELTEQTGAATIDPTEHTVDIEVENGTDLTLLSPTIDVSAGATIDPASGQSRDFSDTLVYTVTAEDATTRQEWAVIVSEAEATGIHHNNNSPVSLYPNPANEKIYFRSNTNNKVTIELYGINGRNYLRKISCGLQTEIDVRNLPAGLYLLKVLTPDKTFTRKWVITE